MNNLTMKHPLQTMESYIFSIASEISGQNSSTMESSFLKAKTLSSGLGSSKREIIPAEIRFLLINRKKGG